MSFDSSFHELAAEVRNWGRWGDDDCLGTLNLITDEAVQSAAATITAGRRVSCAIDLGSNGPQMGQIPHRVNPIHTMGYIDNPDLGDPNNDAMVPHFSDDLVTMGLQAGTHWDSLSHVSYNHHLYNGVPTSSITARDGATVLGIDKIRHLVGRGVLLDLPAAQGIEELQSNHEVTADDLNEAAEFGKVNIAAGDIVLIRTGRIRQFFSGGAQAYLGGPEGDGSTPGPWFDAVRWFRHHDVAAVANDTYIFELFPPPNWDNALAVHCINVVDMGLTQGQNWDLESLSQMCAERGRYEFFLAASPEPFVGGCGAPVNPVVVF